MQKFLAFISFSVLLAISIGCNRVQEIVTPQPQEEPLKIGFVVAGERVTYPNGAEMAVTEINARGGLLGSPVELIGHIIVDSENKWTFQEIKIPRTPLQARFCGVLAQMRSAFLISPMSS